MFLLLARMLYNRVLHRPILEENNQTELMEELQAAVDDDLLEEMSEYATLYAGRSCYKVWQR